MDWLQELKEKNNIVEVISRYVQLQQKGGKFWCCCPFHHEKTASMCVNEDGQFIIASAAENRATSSPL